MESRAKHDTQESAALEGRGLPKDPMEAFAWLQKQIALGHIVPADPRRCRKAIENALLFHPSTRNRLIGGYVAAALLFSLGIAAMFDGGANPYRLGFSLMSLAAICALGIFLIHRGYLWLLRRRFRKLLSECRTTQPV